MTFPTRRLDEDAQCCGCAALADGAEYDVALHVGAIFLIFGVSLLGTLLPIISSKVPFLSSRSIIMEWLMSFGFGVVISTGFIHMMNEGIHMLSNPCLGAVVEEYESLGLAVVLATVVVMHLIECESTVFFASKVGGSQLHGHAHGGHGPHHHDHSRPHSTAIESASPASAMLSPNDEENPYTHLKHLEDHTQPHHVGSTDKDAKRKLAVVLFELGVIFHSIVVGLDLGVTGGTEFKTLLAAMSFHQFFEGIAIGGSALGAMESVRQVLGMNLGFAMTTPLGMAVGMTIRTTYSASSVTSLWVQGILNCVAGGILLYTGLVELMTYQMTTNSEFLGRSGKQRLALYVAFWLGAALMALIGKWA